MKNLDFLKTHPFIYKGIYDNNQIFENSIEAIKLAIKSECNLYLTVCETKDHKYIICENDAMEKLHNQKDAISDMTYDEISYLSFYHIPLLEEVLKLTKNISIIIYPRVNQKNKEIFNILDKYDGKFALISNSTKTINWINKNRPDYVVGEIITKHKGFNLGFYFTKTDFKSFNIEYYDKVRIKNYKDNGEFILGYLVNTKQKYKLYAKNFNNIVLDNYIALTK